MVKDIVTNAVSNMEEGLIAGWSDRGIAGWMDE